LAAKCILAPHPGKCPSRNGKRPTKKRSYGRDLVIEEVHIIEKRADLGFDDVNDSGLLTTTIAPNPVVETETITTGTATLYELNFVTSTRTVDSNPATVTEYTGIQVDVATTTLPRVT
jgi:hypothetical protein